MDLEVSICVCCDREFTPPKQQVMCEGCWWSGDYLAMQMAGLIEVLTIGTDGMPWYAEHTGGGRFWLICYLHGYPEDRDDDYGPVLVLTGEEGPLSGADTVRDVEAAGRWHLGYYLTSGDLLDGDSQSYYPHTEELPMKVREIMRERSGAR